MSSVQPDARRRLADSVVAKLKNISKASGIHMDLLLRRYGLEAFVRRIEAAGLSDELVMKGSMVLAVSNGGDLLRPTVDVDFALMGAPLSAADLEAKLRAVCAADAEDGASFALDTVKFVKERPEDARLGGGGKLAVIFLLGTVRLQVYIDVQVGECHTPELPAVGEFPSLLGGAVARPKVRMMPLEYCIADKLHAASYYGLGNSRLKDFFDIDRLIDQADPGKLAEAVARVFAAHREPLRPPAEWPGLSEEFAAARAAEYRTFATKNRIEPPRSLPEACAGLRALLEPVLEQAAGRSTAPAP